MKQELLQFVTGATGKFASLRLSEDYFVKHDKKALWDYIFEATSDFTQSLSLRERLHIIKHDFRPTNCKICGSPTMLILGEGKAVRQSRYCSNTCASKESENKKIGKTKVDEKLANERRKATMLAKYGTEFNLRRPNVKEKLKRPKVNDFALKFLSDDEWLRNEYVTKGRTAVAIAKDLNCFYGTVLDYCRKFDIPICYLRNTSQQETEVIEWLQGLGVSTKQTDRKLIQPHEIDILASRDTRRLAIELDGLYYHSYGRPESEEERTKHLSKTTRCLEQGVPLVHITDLEWEEKAEIIKSMISSRLGLARVIGARECSIVELSTAESREFFDASHVQGFLPSRLYYGLKHNDTIVSVLALGRPRFAKIYEYEITRFANALNTTVVGGFVRLFKHFVDQQHPTSVITYSDRRFGEGNIYRTAGFNFDHATKPGYFWTDGKDIIPRYLAQKHRLPKLLKNFDPTMSEAQNMFAHRYRRFWDCGHNVYIYGNIGI